MGEQAGGSARFKGPGSIWKSSWKGRRTLSQMCCMEGFDPNFYENANGPLDIDLTDGFFAGALVGITAIPSGPSLIARNGAVANEGWDLYLVDATTDPDVPAVGFVFTVYGGAGPVAQVSIGPLVLGDSWPSLISPVYFPVVMYFGLPFPPDLADGSIGLGVPNDPISPSVTSGGADLSAPYVNSDPHLYFGGDGTNFLLPGACLVGLTGGIDPSASAFGGVAGTARSAANSWKDALEAAGTFVTIPDPFGTGRTIEHQWGIETTAPLAMSPDPLPDTVDSEDLALNQMADYPSVVCASPAVYFSDNRQFPYG